jgi:outer membrane receptor protein involved in Fe transport
MGLRPPAWRIAASGLIGGVLAPTLAQAADLNFSIPEQSREDALLSLARQAGLSLGFAPGAHCEGRVGASGRMSVDTALARLLGGSACIARRTDAHTIIILSRPRRAGPALPAPSAPPAPRPLAPTDVSELVVTAGKTEQLLSTSPSGLTAADGAELRRAGVVGVQDLSLLAAGVTVTNLGPGRDKIILRGLSDGPLTGHAQATVGLYLGDLRLTYNAPDPDLPLIDVARVEVLRGPQGSLYGAGSIGGIVHITPEAPDPSARAGSLSATYASTAHGGASHGLQGVMNQPLGPRLAVRAVAWTEGSAGYIDDRRRGLRNVDRTHRDGLRTSLLWQAASNLDLEASFIEQNIDTRDAHYAEPSIGPLARASAVGQPHDNDFMALALSGHWTPAWGRLTFSLGALDHDVGTTYDASAAPATLAPAGSAPSVFDDRNRIKALVSETRLASTGGGRLHWQAGVFGATGDQTLEASLKAADGRIGYAETRKDRLTESAAFGELSYDLFPQLTLTLGGRLFHAHLSSRSATTLNGPLRSFRGETSNNGFAPKVVLAYRPLDGLLLYGQVAEGYRSPGFNTAGAPGQPFGEAGGAQPLRRYAGDELWNYEIGGRWNAPSLGVSLRAALFQADWTDIQADLVGPAGLPYTVNLGDGRSKGVELEASWRRGGYELKGNLVWQDPELRRPAPDALSRTDIALPGVPGFSYAVSGAYTWAFGEERSLTLRASYIQVGHSRLALDPAVIPTMGDYGDLRLNADATLGPVSVRLFADNLLDRRGDTLAFGNPFTFRASQAATPQRPRTVGVSLTRRF